MTDRPTPDPLVEQAIARTRHPLAGCSDCGGAWRLDGAGHCYECSRIRLGKNPTERDHLAHRATWGSLEVRLRGNDHRRRSDFERALGFDHLPDAGDDPLLLLAHLLAGLATLFAILVDYLIGWSTELTARYGADWAAGLRSPVV